MIAILKNISFFTLLLFIPTYAGDEDRHSLVGEEEEELITPSPPHEEITFTAARFGLVRAIYQETKTEESCAAPLR